MSYNLFLDDVRDPQDCAYYMHHRIGPKNPIYINENWTVVRSYNAFIDAITRFGNPMVISFDHDLGEDIASALVEGGLSKRKARAIKRVQKDGYEAAKWYLAYTRKHSIPPAEIFVHSMNPVGTENIKSVFN